MKTIKKYTIILSAFQATDSYIKNLQATDTLQNYLENTLKLPVEGATGHYKGVEEISFIIHTDSARTVYRLKAHVCKEYNQECILVSSNKHALIELHDMYRPRRIGTHFVQGKGDGLNYTRITGSGKNWRVA